MKQLRTVIAALVTAICVPESGLTDGKPDQQEASREECLLAPSSDCLVEFVIPTAKAQDSPGTHLQAIAETLLLREERDYARQVLEAAIDIGFEGFSSNTGFGANSDLWTVSRIGRLATLLSDNGFRDLQIEVVDLLEGFLERNPGSNAREAALYELFLAFLDLGEFEAALSTADRMSSSTSKWAMYGDVAVVHVEEGRVNEALEIIERVGNPTSQLKSTARVAAALADQGQIELARDLLPGQSSVVAVTNAQKAITSALVGAGRFDEAISYANSISGVFQRAFVQNSTSGALAGAGELESALKLAKSISLRQQRAQAMATVGEVLAARGEIALARDVLAEMPRNAIWQDPVDESLEEARVRLERALNTAARQ